MNEYTPTPMVTVGTRNGIGRAECQRCDWVHDGPDQGVSAAQHLDECPGRTR